MFRTTKIPENAWHFDFDLFSRFREGLARLRSIFTPSERLSSRKVLEKSIESSENSCTGFYPEKMPINRLAARNQLPLFWSLSIAERVFAVKDDCMIKAARRSFLRRLFCKSNFLSLHSPSPGAAPKAGTIAVQVKFLRSGLRMVSWVSDDGKSMGYVDGYKLAI